MEDELTRKSEAYLDALFGDGRGAAHSRFVRHLKHPALREALHRAHVMEADESQLTVEENYLLGLAVLCAQRSFGPAAMFAKTLRHLGTSSERVLEAVARLSMWIGPIPAAEAAGHIQRALREYDKDGLASMDAWFPPAREAAHE